jgi:DnaJ-class molecular chaperone
MPQQIDFDPSVDYYKALGVSSTASAEDIKRAYRKLAKANHPDSTGGDKAKESRFKDISNAYDVLGDAKKRAMYDEIRANGGLRQGFPGTYTYTSQGGGPGVFDLGDLFNQFFSGRGGARTRVEQIDFDEHPRARPRRRDPEDDADDLKASDGTPLRSRELDVFSDVRVSFDRAILGTVVTVATIDGTVELKIPPGTSSGKKLRLRGKGIPGQRRRAGEVGDHYVTVQIDVPHELDDEAKKLLSQLATRLRKRGRND